MGLLSRLATCLIAVTKYSGKRLKEGRAGFGSQCVCVCGGHGVGGAWCGGTQCGDARCKGVFHQQGKEWKQGHRAAGHTLP